MPFDTGVVATPTWDDVEIPRGIFGLRCDFRHESIFFGLRSLCPYCPAARTSLTSISPP